MNVTSLVNVATSPAVISSDEIASSIAGTMTVHSSTTPITTAKAGRYRRSNTPHTRRSTGTRCSNSHARIPAPFSAPRR